MSRLVLDIETVGDDFSTYDTETQGILTRWIDRESESDEVRARSLETLKSGLGFSPLTGRIVTIGVLDIDKGTGAVYFDAPGIEPIDFEEDGFRFRSLSEEAMLTRFWEIAEKYDEFISFNGRAFDVPFLVVRSAAHRVKISRDLMDNRYAMPGKSKVQHIDLMDHLSYFGAVRRKWGLHLWCRALGIKSPKAD
jgi:DNA polymerase elongation subunit (family B)